MPSLHIYNDSPDFSDRATSDRSMPAPLTRYPCSTRETFIATIGALWGGTTTFYKIAVDTHGNKGMIFFNHQPIDAGWWNRSALVAPRAPSLSMPRAGSIIRVSSIIACRSPRTCR